MTRLIWVAVFGMLLAPAPARAQDEVIYYHTDAIGSVRMITDAAGVVLDRYDYSPFGEAPPPTFADPRRFAGKEKDEETGLDYFGARYYRGESGRFTSVDPVLNLELALLDPQRWARYTYARNNPLRYIDPNGEDIFDIVMGAVNAFGSNLALGGGRLQPNNADFALGQRVGDIAAMVAGMSEAVLGATMAGGGTAVSASGVGAPIGLSVAAVGTLAAVHGVGVTAVASVQFMKGQGDRGGGGTEPSREVTPTTHKDQFGPVRGTPGRRHTETGEIWKKDPFHKNHYEVYKNRKDFDNGHRHRAVWEDGRIKEYF